MILFRLPPPPYAHAEGRGRFPPPRARPPTPSIINPAGFSFTSAGIMDAIKAFEGPVLESCDVVTRLEKILELLRAGQQAA
jgi:hypothetical protein